MPTYSRRTGFRAWMRMGRPPAGDDSPSSRKGCDSEPRLAPAEPQEKPAGSSVPRDTNPTPNHSQK